MWHTKGHGALVERLESAVLNKTISHAYIFYGSRHVGKMTCALDVARGLNCTHESEFACGECIQCSRIHNRLHADIRVISPRKSENKTSIGINDVRDILHVSHMKPYEGTYRVTIIDDADSMTLEASNALLKTLEEPADQNVFFLITSNEDALIPTIRSRCQSIYFSILDESTIRDYLTEYHSESDQQIELLTSLCAGKLGWAVDAINDTTLMEDRDKALELFWDLFHKELDRGFEISEYLSNEYYNNAQYVVDTLGYWNDLFRDLLILKKATSDLIHNIDVEDRLLDIVDSCYEYDLTDNIRFVLDAREQLQNNVIPRLCLDNLILKIKQKTI